MNCEQVSVVLDTHSRGGLAPPLKQAVERHLESCCECRAAWAAYLLKLGAIKLSGVKAALGKFRKRGAAGKSAGTGGGESSDGADEFIADGGGEAGRIETAKTAAHLLGEAPEPQAKPQKPEPAPIITRYFPAASNGSSTV